MKKFLLSASVLMLASTAFAATDGQTYEPKKGYTCENLWVFDRFHTPDEYGASKIASTSARTATTDGKIVYVGLSGETASIEKYSVETGEYLGALDLKLNGEAYAGTLAANQVGFDEYGNFYVASYSANSDGTGGLALYTCNLETGELTSVGELSFMGCIGRVDYCDVVGDLTGVNAGATIMAATSAQDALNVFAWTRGQGETAWAGAWPTTLPYQAMTQTYPADQTGFSYGSVLKQVKDGSANGQMFMFYIDGFTTLPATYSTEGAMVESFADVAVEQKDPETGDVIVPGVVSPASGTNGVAEGHVGDQNIFVFSEGQYDAPHSCQAVVTLVDESFAMSSMEQMWLVPADGLGQTSDTGTRVHGLSTIALDPDANGKNAMLLVTFKCYNGMGVYRIAEEGYNPNASVANNVVSNATIRVNGDVIAVSEVAESIEVYNVAGQKVAEVHNASEVAAPANGLYIVKAVVNGAPVVKKVIL